MSQAILQTIARAVAQANHFQRVPMLLLAAVVVAGCIDGSIGDAVQLGDGGTMGVGGDAAAGGGDGGAGGSAMAPQPEQIAPCEEGVCWDADAYVAECGYAAIDENFQTGNYNVHRYATKLWASTKTTITLSRFSGDWQPALIVADADGVVLFDGQVGATSATLTATPIETGLDGDEAEVLIESNQTLDIDIYVTGWQVVGSDFVDFLPMDASYGLDVDSDCSSDDPVDIIAPPGALAGEQPGYDGDNAIGLGDTAWGPALRFDVPAQTHVGFKLTFAPSSADVDMQVLQWTGNSAQQMATTNGGSGERVLAVLDPGANRTYWVRARGAVTSASLHAEVTPFQEGAQCQSDCDRMLQLPLANDPLIDGYDSADYVVYRYQFGRRDVLMSLRHAGRVVAASGVQAFTVQDLSKEDGSKPPGHASHTFGKDVDISVYDAQGHPVWYPLCDEINDECIPGTDKGFHGEAMARKIAPMLESSRVTHIFLDAEFHMTLFAAAEGLVDNGEMAPALLPYMEDVVQHWPNHNNHIHVRYESDPY